MKNTEISSAIACYPGKNFAEGASRGIGIPDYERACAQHLDYCDALRKCGVIVTSLPGGCFVNNIAVVTEYLAVIGNFSDDDQRQCEKKGLASVLAGARCLKFITAPGRLDCSDVLRVGDHFYIGLTEGTNHEGAAQLGFFLKEYGYPVTITDLTGGNSLHLGAAAADLEKNRLLIREELAPHFEFIGYEKIVVPYEERGAANARMVNGTLLLPAGYAATLRAVKKSGIPFIEVNVSEFEKMGSGLGCLSLCLPKNGNSGVIEMPVKKKVAA
jgi:dimethylargininase